MKANKTGVQVLLKVVIYFVFFNRYMVKNSKGTKGYIVISKPPTHLYLTAVILPKDTTATGYLCISLEIVCAYTAHEYVVGFFSVFFT